jgi:hypothetical protein
MDFWITLLEDDSNRQRRETFLEGIPKDWTVAQLRRKIYQEKLFYFDHSTVETDLILYYDENTTESQQNNDHNGTGSERKYLELTPRSSLADIVEKYHQDKQNKPNIYVRGKNL